MNRNYPVQPVVPLLVQLLVPLLAAGSAYAEDEHYLSSRAEAAEVEINPMPRNKRQLRVPALEFALQIEAGCAGDTRAQSISVSVADTVESHDVSDQDTEQVGHVLLESTLRVPGRQIAPLVIEGFCVSDDDPGSAAQTLTISAAVAADISLRCASDTTQSVRYDRLPLQIEFICVAADEEIPN